MEDSKVTLTDSHFNLDFLNETVESPKVSGKMPYKVLIVDDDFEMHNATRLLLRNFQFEERGLQLLSAYSGQEAIEILKAMDDIALVFLDVVMEENDSGLKVVDYIRKVLKNVNIRIVLRTGQPGEAPEERIIAEYDINDFRLKTELTVQRLYTSVYEALRSYRDLMALEHQRKGLEQIVSISAHFFTLTSIEDFYSCILDQIIAFKSPEASAIYFREKRDTGGIIFLDDQTFGTIIAATGKFSDTIGKNIQDVEAVRWILEKAVALESGDDDAVLPLESGYLVYKSSRAGFRSFIYVEGPDLNLDTNMIRIFLNNYSLALDNYMINQRKLQTQKEIITILGDTIEARYPELGSHVKRVGLIAGILAMGLSDELVEVVEISGMIHDIGKIAIPTDILKKPGPLSDDEFNLVKNHGERGSEILGRSSLEILKWSAEIARHHHEWHDGNGYPKGLSGDDIPLPAQIVSVADVFDSLTHQSAYKSAWPIEKAIAYIVEKNGEQFDPAVIKAFVSNIDSIRNILDEDAK